MFCCHLNLTRVRLLIVSALVLITWGARTPCYAEARCPWLNAATVAGVLGGEVQTVVTEPIEHTPGQGTYQTKDQIRNDRYDVNCEFSRKAGDKANILKIVVETMKDPGKDFQKFLMRCGGTPISLKAIGNEAIQCRENSSSASGEEQVIARVRDRVFVLTVSRPVLASQSTDASRELRSDTRNMAEQIAGSLF